MPDFLIHATRDRVKHTYVIDTMGLDHPVDLQGKERSHARMEELGPLCLMDAREFDPEGRRLTEEGLSVTRRICS